MTDLGTAKNPLRVAIIGAGPTGFYAADSLFQRKDLVIQVDMFDRLPTPFGLVRGGVAPDHQKIKSVTKVFDKIARHPNYRFFGYVEFGKQITLADLRAHYHQILYTTGAQTDHHMNIPGEDLPGSHAATEFVDWYNGHPDCLDCKFDLSQEEVAVVGVGNVALDVARILCLPVDELAKTDIADYALAALSQSRVKDVHILGRRGPAQAAFSATEIKELGELSEADLTVLPAEIELDALSRQAVENDSTIQKKMALLQEYAKQKPLGKKRRLALRFLVSPVELFGNEAGQVTRLRLVKNELYVTEKGDLRSRATNQFEELPVGLVFRSVGYQGVPLPGVPFDDKRNVILNERGRVISSETTQPVLGEYTAGWIKRGPSGVIGTNKPDAVETVGLMLEDLAAGKTLTPPEPTGEAVTVLVQQRQPNYFSYADWLRLDELEIAKGQKAGRPRVKFTHIDDMLDALGR